MYRIILCTVVVILLYWLVKGWMQRRQSKSATTVSKIPREDFAKEQIIEADFSDIEESNKP